MELPTQRKPLVPGDVAVVRDAGGFYVNKCLKGRTVEILDPNLDEYFVRRDPDWDEPYSVTGIPLNQITKDEMLIAYVQELDQVWRIRQQGTKSTRYPNPAEYDIVGDEDATDLDADELTELDFEADGEEEENAPQSFSSIVPQASATIEVKDVSDMAAVLVVIFRTIFHSGPATIGFYQGVDGREHKVVAVCDPKDGLIEKDIHGENRVKIKALKREVRRLMHMQDQELKKENKIAAETKAISYEQFEALKAAEKKAIPHTHTLAAPANNIEIRIHLSDEAGNKPDPVTKESLGVNGILDSANKPTPINEQTFAFSPEK